MRNLPFFIARRYLFAKKSHNVINIISAISSVGMAVGTAALIVILSVYNGFDALIKTMVSDVEPDLMIVPAQGKFFIPDSGTLEWIGSSSEIRSACRTLEDNVFISYGSSQGTALLRGVDSLWAGESKISGKLTDGSFRLMHGEIPYVATGASFAASMGINHRFVSPIELYYPDASMRFNAANPMSSLLSLNVWTSCTFSINPTIDSKLIISDIGVASRILGRSPDEVSAIELRFREELHGRKASALKAEISERLGQDYRVLDRMEQNPSLYKMLRYEKASVYLILVFVTLVLGFSIFGSLTMLLIEKSDDVQTLKALGADRKTIRKCFILEGWMITLVGLAIGLAAGIAVSLVQQHFGIVGMPGDFVVDAYPVVLKWIDVLVCAVSIAAAGYIIALIPTRRID